MNAAGDRRTDLIWVFGNTYRRNKWSRQHFSKNRRVVKNRFPYSTKIVVKLFSTMGFIFDHFFAPTICLRFQQPLRFFPRHQHFNKNFKFVAGSRFFHLIENANILKQDNFLLRMQPVTGKCTICMKWCEPVTGQMTWFGFLPTHKENKMVASTIF